MQRRRYANFRGNHSSLRTFAHHTLTCAGATVTHQVICKWTKRNLKHFHDLKREIGQLKRTFLGQLLRVAASVLRPALTWLSHSAWGVGAPPRAQLPPAHLRHLATDHHRHLRVLLPVLFSLLCIHILSLGEGHNIYVKSCIKEKIHI